MSGDRYLVSDQQQTYFITCTIVKWVDIFTRYEYKEIIVDSLNYSIKTKGLRLNGWVLMSNHLHFPGKCEDSHHISDFLRDFKKFTSKKIAATIQDIPESRREWLLDIFGLKPKDQGEQIIIKYGGMIIML